MQAMAQSITERVRLSPEEERKLSEVAKRTGRSKSEVLRDGLHEQWRKADQDEARRRAWDDLIRAADEIAGSPKPRWRQKP
jgi:predicted transcriptional regulator